MCVWNSISGEISYRPQRQAAGPICHGRHAYLINARPTFFASSPSPNIQRDNVPSTSALRRANSKDNSSYNAALRLGSGVQEKKRVLGKQREWEVIGMRRMMMRKAYE